MKPRFKPSVCPRVCGCIVRKNEIADLAARRAYVEAAKAHLRALAKEAAE